MMVFQKAELDVNILSPTVPLPLLDSSHPVFTDHPVFTVSHLEEA